MTSIDEVWDIGEDLNIIEVVDDGISTDEIIDNNQPFSFEITSENRHVDLPEMTIIKYENDKTVSKTYAAHTRQNKQVFVNKLSGTRGIGRPIWTNATINGFVAHKANGELIVSVNAGGKTKYITFNLTGIPNSTDEIIGNAPGWVRENAVNNVDNRILIGGDKTIFTTQNHTTATYVRNTNCWCADLDLTAISPWNSTGVQYRAGTLITPRHIIMAEHYMIGIGATIRFVTADNTVVTRTVSNRWSDASNDLAIGLLDSDVPGTIGFVKCLPEDWGNYIIDPTELIPVVKTDYEEKILCEDIYTLGGGVYTDVYLQKPIDSNRLTYYEAWISGDSGSPAFLIINGELVIICCAHTSTFGPAIHYYYDIINSALTSLGGGYQLTPIDLTGFRSI